MTNYADYIIQEQSKQSLSNEVSKYNCFSFAKRMIIVNKSKMDEYSTLNKLIQLINDNNIPIEIKTNAKYWYLGMFDTAQDQFLESLDKHNLRY